MIEYLRIITLRLAFQVILHLTITLLSSNSHSILCSLINYYLISSIQYGVHRLLHVIRKNEVAVDTRCLQCYPIGNENEHINRILCLNAITFAWSCICELNRWSAICLCVETTLEYFLELALHAQFHLKKSYFDQFTVYSWLKLRHMKHHENLACNFALSDPMMDVLLETFLP